MSSSKSGRINLLLKQYYEQQSDVVENPYELSRLEKLKTDSLMSKSVESLRSYKEAESELRMLLFNNCDKLLEAVQVVVSIRTESAGLIDLSNDLSQCGNRLDLITSRRNTHPETKELQALLKLEKTVGMIEKILFLPEMLKNESTSPEDRLRLYLKVRSDFFDSKFVKKYPLAIRAASDSLAIVESSLVPPIESRMIDKFDLVKLLLELYPESSSKRERIIVEYLEGEIVRWESLSEPTCPHEALNQLKHFLDLFFLGNELREGNEKYVHKIGSELLPRASERILKSLMDCSGNVGTDGKVGGEFLAECVRVHMRIPGVDMQQVEAFRKHAIENSIRGKFLTIFLKDNLTESDVIHTQCCATIVDVYEWLTKVEETANDLDEMVVMSFSDIGESVILNCIKEYYGRILLPVAEIGESEDLKNFDALYRSIEVIKHVHNRRMFSRTLNAVRDIFELDESVGSEMSGFDAECVWQVMRTVGGNIGSDIGRLEETITRVAGILESWTVEGSETTVSNSGSFRSRMVSAMTGFTIRGGRTSQQQQQQWKLKELEMDEMVLARRLATPALGTDVCRGSIFMLVSMFLRTLSGASKIEHRDRIEKILNEWFAGDDLDIGDMRQTLELMLKDVGDRDN